MIYPFYLETQNVGKRFRDNSMLPVGFEVVNGEVTSEAMRDPKVLEQAFQEYVVNQTGLLAGDFPGCAVLSLSQILATKNY